VTALSPGRSPDDDAPPQLSDGRYDSFVVRVLRRADQGGFVHGQVTHVGTRASIHFTDLASAMGFIMDHLDERPSDAPRSSAAQ
jgi:hypothetical protein